jgi:4'-phosphopantetheinyl transferase
LIRYAYNAFGKPGLSPDLGGRLEFNLSHSDGLAVIAIASDSAVGVDLECIRAKSDLAEIARRFYSAAEAEQLNALPGHVRAEAFTRCWTMKEACLKACGGGLAIPLDRVAVPVTAASAPGPVDVRVAANDVVPAARWSVYSLHPGPGFVGALAIQGSCWRLSQWRWTARPD